MPGGEASGRREALTQRLLFVVLVVLLPLALASLTNIFNDGDVSWHIAAGRWIIEHRAIPSTDPFSFTMGGRPWMAIEWLAEIILAGVFAAAGYAGLTALVAAALMALHIVLFIHLERRASPVVVAATLLAMDVVLSTFLLARPHVLAWPLLALWTALLAKASETGRPPPLWAALLLVLWVNLH